MENGFDDPGKQLRYLIEPANVPSFNSHPKKILINPYDDSLNFEVKWVFPEELLAEQSTVRVPVVFLAPSLATRQAEVLRWVLSPGFFLDREFQLAFSESHCAAYAVATAWRYPS